LSCRIIGKNVETVFLNEILRDARRAGMELVRGQYVPTWKNRLVAGFYSQHGFRVQDAASGTWTLNSADFFREAEPWVTIQRRCTSTPR
jgi:predicted enzyme involved in methoxymalonyl-ACP biosynthesis